MALVDQEQVNQAAEAVAARNERVTVANVRSELGGGSFSTIAPLVKAWKEQHTAEAAAAEELPDEAKQAGEEAARKIWSAAQADAAERIEHIRADADQRVANAETANQEALAEVRRLEKTLEERETEYQTLEKSLDGARESSREYEAAVQARDATITSLREQLDEKSRAVENAQGKLDDLREQLGSEKSRADETQKYLDAERGEHATTQKFLDESRKANEENRSRADKAEERLQSAHDTIDELKGEREKYQAEAREAVQTIEHERAQKVFEAQRVADLEKKLDALQKDGGQPGADHPGDDETEIHRL